MSGIHAGPPAPMRQRPPGGEPPPPEAASGRGRDEGGSATGRRAGSVGWGLALIAVGVLWLLSLAGVAVPWQTVLPAALVVVGLAILVWPRGGGQGLVGPGVVLLALTLILAVLPGSSVSGGERTHVVTEVAALEDAYDLGAGTLVLDLGSLPVSEDTEVSARVGMGELVVVVPEDVRLDGRARVGLGDVDVLGEAVGGVAPVVDLDAGVGDGDVLTLDLQVGLGRIEVRR